MKVFRALNRILDALLLILCVLAFLCGLYTVIDSAIVFQHASDPSLLKYKPSAAAAETEEEALPGEVAWLTIPDTHIDYPVMQGIDNTEYLNKDPYGKYSFSGSIFLDVNNSPDFSDSYSLIYGHHMEAGKMFGDLDDFLKKGYFDRHENGYLTVGEKRYSIHFFASFRTTAQSNVFFDVTWTNSRRVMQRLSSSSFETSVNESAGDETHLIALSTCRDTDSPERTVVLGELKEDSAAGTSETEREIRTD